MATKPQPLWVSRVRPGGSKGLRTVVGNAYVSTSEWRKKAETSIGCRCNHTGARELRLTTMLSVISVFTEISKQIKSLNFSSIDQLCLPLESQHFTNFIAKFHKAGQGPGWPGANLGIPGRGGLEELGQFTQS